MNEENRKKVEAYLNSSKVESTSSLIFEGYTSNKEEFDSTKYSVEEMIDRTIELSREYVSINSETDGFETAKNRSRSSLDIWRHIKYYYPFITIFDVIATLYSMAAIKKEVCGIFCPDINRRIFRLTRFDGENYDSYDPQNNSWVTTEYNVDFKDWKDI